MKAGQEPDVSKTFELVRSGRGGSPTILNAIRHLKPGAGSNVSDLWQQWKTEYEGSGLSWNDVTRDGAIKPAKYRNANPKVVFVLKETNDFGGGNLQDLLAEGPKYQTWHAISRWAAGLLGGFPPYEDVNRASVKTEALHQIAAVNLKKVTGGSSSRTMEIHAFAMHDRRLLRRQFKELAPDCVVCCGTYTPALWLLELKVDPRHPDAAPVWSDTLSAWVIPFRHPSRSSGTESYAALEESARRCGEMFAASNAG